MTPPVRQDSDPDLGAALRRTLHRRAVAEGTITLPAVPALLDEYVRLCLTTFGAIGVDFDDSQQASLRDTIAEQLDIAFSASPRSEIVITYDAPVGQIVNYHVRPQWASIERTYDAWVVTREPPYFGTEPDARVWALAAEHEDPRACAVLDIGAGSGRNSLALARRGHPVDALEVSGQLADVLREEARQRSLGIRVIQRDLFTARDFLPDDYQLVIVSEVTSDLRSADELRQVFSLAAEALVHGGQLALNAFIAAEGYEPGAAARQIGQQTYSAIFTRAELEQATAGLPLTLIDDTSVYDYEHEHLPPQSWPPTGWYEGWVLGRDAFGLDRPSTPMEMRWLVYRKSGDPGA
jgi:SAM-dependent methyltransferase